MSGCATCSKGCHGPNVKSGGTKKAAERRVAVIGQPNCGKSMLFNRITKAGAYVGNWPGVTVDLLQATVDVDGQLVEFVDLPGLYDLEGYSEDERVVQNFLERNPLDLILVVANASQIDRQARMILQVKQLGIPAIVLLNMADEARNFGIQIDTQLLGQRWNLPTFLISAKYGQGFVEAFAEIALQLREPREVREPLKNIREHLSEQRPSESDLQAVLTDAVIMPPPDQVTRTDRIDRWMLHPVLGLPLFLVAMAVVFAFVWNIGLPSQDVAGVLTGWIQTYLIEPVINPLPDGLKDFILNGVWNGVATVASFVPLVVIFFFCMAAIEDSGYLSRAAFMMDAFMSKLGLDGRGFVMQIMGFGCNVPALMGTRVIRSRSMRLLNMMIIPFSLCSARLAVFVFIIAAVFPSSYGWVILFLLYVLSFASAFLAALILQRHRHFVSVEPFVLELPPYRMPTVKQVLLRGCGEVREFLRRATSFIILGCMAIWFLTNYPIGATGVHTWGGQIGQWMAPVMDPIGVVDAHLTLALIFGFIAKEVVLGALATIYAMNEDGVAQAIGQALTPADAIGFCVFTLLYTPCLSTVATIKAESKSWPFTIFSLVFSLVYAWAMAYVFRELAMIIGL
ncbi:MAG: ferrous iron transport protein B [Burkholderiaceae bacterium]|nr:ferrous iron transport protein B [Burkholderiaceae bacterium]